MTKRLSPRTALSATTPTTTPSTTSGISRRLMGSNTRTSSASTAEKFFSGCAPLKSIWRANTRTHPSRAVIARPSSSMRAVFRLKKLVSCKNLYCPIFCVCKGLIEKKWNRKTLFSTGIYNAPYSIVKISFNPSQVIDFDFVRYY